MDKMEESDGEFVRVNWVDPNSSFAKIVFTDVKELYSCIADIKCEYVVMPDHDTEQEEAESNDKGKVGIYKVGWSTGSVDECVFSVDVDLNQAISGHSQRVTFRAESLPKEEGEVSDYFQFCFINAKQQVRGMSIPFRFSKSEIEVFVDEIENDVQFVQTQSSLLQEKIDNILMQNGCLITENSQLQVLVEELTDEKAKIEKVIKERDLIILDLEQRILDSQFLSKEQITKNEGLVNEIQSTIIGLKMEKDELEIKLAAVTANRNLFKEKHRLAEISSKNISLLQKHKCENLEKSYAQTSRNLQSVEDKLKVEQNMLSAMTISKQMAVKELQEQCNINEELQIEKNKLHIELKQVKQLLKISTAEKLECQSKYSDMKAVFEMYRRLSENSKTETEKLEIQLSDAKKSLEACYAEKLECQSENKKLYSIILASESRYQILQKKMESVDNVEISLLKDQIVRFQNQIEMCAKEYRKKYIDWHKALKQADKFKEFIQESGRMDTFSDSGRTAHCLTSVDHMTFLSQMDQHSLKESLNDEQKAKIVAEMENQLQKFKTSNSPKLSRSKTAMEAEGYRRLNAMKVEIDNDFDELNSNSSHDSQFFEICDYYNPNDEPRPLAAPETSTVEPIMSRLNDECLRLSVNSASEALVDEKIYSVCPMCAQTFEKEIGFEFFEQHVNEHF